MIRRLVFVLMVISLVVPMLATVAIADPVDDIVHDQLNCQPNPVNPLLSNNKVQGSGSISGCRFFMSFDVCLDYNGMIYRPSCRTYNYPSTSGTTNAVNCLHGVWATTVIVTPPPAGNTVLTYIDRHSNPLVIVKDCQIQTGAGEPGP